MLDKIAELQISIARVHQVRDSIIDKKLCKALSGDGLVYVCQVLDVKFRMDFSDTKQDKTSFVSFLV